MKRIARLLFAAGTAVALCSSPALAKDKDHDHGKNRDKFEKHDRDHDRDDRWRHDHDRDHDRDHVRHTSSTPPGWEHGRKTGWGNCNLPPGQAKKQGCHSTWVNDRDHDRDHDRDRDRRIARERAERQRERERIEARERERRERERREHERWLAEHHRHGNSAPLAGTNAAVDTRHDVAVRK